MTAAKTEDPFELVPEVDIPGSDSQPDWVAAEMPPRYIEIAGRLAVLKQEAREFERVGEVLWQTGSALTRGIRDLFTALQFETEMTGHGTNYDLSVRMDSGRRLLVEVVGGTGAITKKSPQIAQALRAIQEDAGEKDRVVLVGNAFCEKPPAARKEDPVAPDALRLIQGLGANFVATATLFGIWRYSLQNLQEARKSIMNLHDLDGGVFR
jgi:hypothetical protein